MKKQTVMLADLGVAVFSIAVLFSIPLLAEEEGHHHGGHDAHTPPAAGSAPATSAAPAIHKMCMQKLDEAVKAIDAATKAIEADQRLEALYELKKAKEVVAGCQKILSEAGGAKIVNIRCPI